MCWSGRMNSACSPLGFVSRAGKEPRDWTWPRGRGPGRRSCSGAAALHWERACDEFIPFPVPFFIPFPSPSQPCCSPRAPCRPAVPSCCPRSRTSAPHSLLPTPAPGRQMQNRTLPSLLRISPVLSGTDALRFLQTPFLMASVAVWGRRASLPPGRGAFSSRVFPGEGAGPTAAPSCWCSISSIGAAARRLREDHFCCLQQDPAPRRSRLAPCPVSGYR